MLKTVIIMKYEQQLKNNTEKTLLACLADVPFLSVKQIKKEPLNNWADLLIKLDLSDVYLFLIVEIKSCGQPKCVFKKEFVI